MKLIVGLGNPGKQYEKTRHNIGFMALDNYLNNEKFKVKENFETYEKIINNEKVLFLKPLTYMNDSGIAVKKVMDYYKVSLNDLLIIYDDMDFEVGNFKLKQSGSSAGHNGLKSIIAHIGTENFKRLRIGISKPKAQEDTINFVLGRFSNEDMNTINNVLEVVNNIIEDFCTIDFERLMSKYNK